MTKLFRSPAMRRYRLQTGRSARVVASAPANPSRSSVGISSAATGRMRALSISATLAMTGVPEAIISFTASTAPRTRIARRGHSRTHCPQYRQRSATTRA